MVKIGHNSGGSDFLAEFSVIFAAEGFGPFISSLSLLVGAACFDDERGDGERQAVTVFLCLPGARDAGFVVAPKLNGVTDTVTLGAAKDTFVGDK